ncbi:Beta-barrel assembly machine subunit BamA [Candidatus Methylacidithermus pantelleriae]|uniref:Outer membrane protein assembly factor BamA n=2 Tax=Candidatus Methylacidithermus pantelleriae TaxID=2744239 RepID=A0A8J2FRJ7_9BACT|nr:Beta-barrel assembly machine subunit BamA [Candidatus Methylacidithermus pantelleriae]
MRTTVGQPYNPATVEEDVRNLYATGRFVNLRISHEPLADGVKVIVIVQPKPLVKEVIIQGNQEVSTKRLRKEVKTKPGDPLNELQISTDAEKIKDYYLSKGYGRAQVTYRIDVNEEFGRAVVSFNIVEGPKEFVSEVGFEGVHAFPEKELRKLLKTRKKNLLSFINKSGLFKEDQFQEDLAKLKEYYQNHGYIDMTVRDVRFEHPEKGKLVIVISVSEGTQYHVGKLRIEGNRLYSEPEIRKYLKLKEGAVFSPQALEDDTKAIRDLYGLKGYIDADVKPERVPVAEHGTIDLVYHISEGSQIYVDKVIVQGNTKTKDKVIRRELAVGPGDVYNSVSVDASKKRLENLGYFERVDISPEETNIPNRRNVVVTVSEKRTGNVTFGVGFSSVESFLGFVELSQGNFDITNPPYFTGAGQKFRLRLQLGLLTKNVILSFTEPWFLNRRLAVGFDLFADEFDYSGFNIYNERRIGGDIRLAKALSPFWTIAPMYRYQVYELFHINFPFHDPFYLNLLNANKSLSESSVLLNLTYDTRDSLLIPRRGEKINILLQGAGGPLLGQTNIYRAELDWQKYVLLPYDLIFSVNGATGVINHYGASAFVPLFDRYFLGGPRTVRGFDYNMVGPKDPLGFSIGGSTMAFSQFELTFPIISRVRGAVFTDWGFVDAGFGRYDHFLPDLNGSAGIGVRLYLPIGPLRLDYGWPIKADRFNRTSGRFAFDVGYAF